jgi:hypothetical protein
MRRTSELRCACPVCREPRRSALCQRGCWAGQVKYASLPNFEEREEDFRAESVILRRRFTEEGPGQPHGAWYELCQPQGRRRLVPMSLYVPSSEQK